MQTTTRRGFGLGLLALAGGKALARSATAAATRGNSPASAAAREAGLRATAQKLFRERGWPPSRVVDAIVGAIGHAIAVRPVGSEAWAAWGLERLAPCALGDRLGRVMHRQVEQRRARG